MRAVPAGLIALVVVAIALVAAGCGGGDDESAKRSETTATADRAEAAATAPRTTTTPARGAPAGSTRRGNALTAAEYRSTLNRLCRQDRVAVDRLGTIDDAQSIAPYLRRAIRYSKQREPLYERLRPPARLRADHKTSIRLNDEAERILTGLLARIERGGDPVKEFTKAGPPLARVINSNNRLSRRIGTKECIVEVPSPSAQSPQNSS